MPPPFPVVLAGYDPKWPERAAEFASRLRVLGPVLITVHHIGSTSVPGLAAKPIIDLMPVVTDLAALDRQRARRARTCGDALASGPVGRPPPARPAGHRRDPGRYCAARSTRSSAESEQRGAELFRVAPTFGHRRSSAQPFDCLGGMIQVPKREPCCERCDRLRCCPSGYQRGASKLGRCERDSVWIDRRLRFEHAGLDVSARFVAG